METIKLDLIPGKKMPSLHASQFDDGREHGIDLFENGVVYKLDGTETLTINERKGDGCICSLDIENTFTGSNHIVFASTEQMCAVWGNNICELVIAKGEKTIGTLNFILEVEPSPTEGGIESESEISNLERQITEITEEVIGDDYYTAEETDEAIATAIEGKADTTYVNTELAKKADKTNTYTKTEVDNSLNNKMDKANPTGTGKIAVGQGVVASGAGSQAFGVISTASGVASHAEGFGTTASGESSHAEGYQTVASGKHSHAEGYQTVASGHFQHVSGKYNVVDNNNTYAEIIGNGGNSYARSNARTLDWSGNETLAGDLTYNGNQSITSEVQRLDGRIDALPEAMVFKGTLGVGGTIQTLPTASASNEGYTYKVITDGTYADQTAKVGDVFTSDGSTWVLIPAGDEDTDTWRAIKVNGVEKLGNGISSGSLDVVDTDNIEAEFDNNGNKLKIKTKNIYTQSEVDAIVDSILPTDSVAKSAIATFETDLAKPIELKAYIVATQEPGTPTPSTPLPISGVSSAKVAKTNGDDSALITALRGLLLGTHNFVKFEDLSLSYSNNSGQWNCYLFYALITNKKRAKAVFCSDYPVVSGTPQDMSDKQCTAPTWNDYFYVRDDTYTTIPDFTSAKGNAILIYECDTPITPTITVEQFNTICQAFGISGETVTIALGDTYYGGYVTQDKAGHRQFEVTHGCNVYIGADSENWSYNGTRFSISVLDMQNSTSRLEVMCNRGYYHINATTDGVIFGYARSLYYYLSTETSVADFKTWLSNNNLVVVYPLATPIVIDLPDGEPINALIGTNNLFADSGDMECSFKCGVAMYVDNHSGGGNRSLAKSGGEETIDEPKEEVKTIGDTKKLGGE